MSQLGFAPSTDPGLKNPRAHLDEQHRHRLFEFGIMPSSAVDGFGNVFEHEVQKDFVGLLAVRVVKEPQRADVGVRNETHDLQFTVLKKRKVKKKGR